MTLRTKSRGQEALVRIALTAAAVVVYVAAVRAWGGDADYGAVLRQDRMRFFLPVVIVYGVLLYETRYDRNASKRRYKAHAAAVVEDAAPRTNEDQPAAAPSEAAPSAPAPEVAAPVAEPETDAPTALTEERRRFSPGHEAYVRAREIPHQSIPDFVYDKEYLEKLGEAANYGYPPALVKLGEYALRRQAWVEAYYWMWYAKRRGAAHLGRTLLDIRVAWAMAGYSDQADNVHALFTEEHGSIARALLDMDSGRNVEQSRSYLETVGVLSHTPLAIGP